MQNNALNFECLRNRRWQRFLAFSKVNHFKNGVFMQKILRNLLIYVLFYECCAFFCELCDYSGIMRSDANWGRLCEIAPSRNIRRPDELTLYGEDKMHSSKLWSSQSWMQFKQLPIEAWKSQDFNGVWTRHLTIPVSRGHGFEPRWSPDFFRLLYAIA